MRVTVDGELEPGVTAKDLTLAHMSKDMVTIACLDLPFDDDIHAVPLIALSKDCRTRWCVNLFEQSGNFDQYFVRCSCKDINGSQNDHLFNRQQHGGLSTVG